MNKLWKCILWRLGEMWKWYGIINDRGLAGKRIVMKIFEPVPEGWFQVSLGDKGEKKGWLKPKE